MKIAPSILSADFSCLRREIRSISHADYIHIDVMDGHFVPNITMGPVIFQNLKRYTTIPFDVHLMISHPLQYAKAFMDAGADILTFHYETKDDIQELIRIIHAQGVKVGVSIKPNTDVVVLQPYLKDLDLILVMSVEPGFGGQSFLLSALDKIRYLKKMKEEENLHFVIEVDGGINRETAKSVALAGCDIIVAGTYIFREKNRNKIIKELKSL